MTAISLHGVTKRFGAVTALDGIELDVGAGELLALLGPSGCGKTTLLRVIAGLEWPDHGRVLIDGQDVTELSTRRRPIGMVFQSYALFPNLTLRQNLAFPLEVRRWPKARVSARVDELLELVHLQVEADRYPHQVSGGQAQRCALARALAPDPRVLLLDEPLSALDVVVRQRLRDEIRRVQQKVGTTTIYVTHDQSEALAIADRVAVMNHGTIDQLGSAQDVYDRPASTFSATFVGSRNVIDLPVRDGRVALDGLFEVAAPARSDGQVTCFIAPEDVLLESPGKGKPALVLGRTFHGATSRVELQLEHAGRLVTVYADVSSRLAATLRDGDRVAVAVSAANVRCFPADDVSDR